MSADVFLCSDLDRTILPNGPQQESPQARRRLQALAAHPRVVLTYVSGRHKALLLDAIREYMIPIPDYAIGDVGTTIYEVSGNNWHAWPAWGETIASDWQGMEWHGLAALLKNVDQLALQEPEKQNTFKLSYYVPETIDCDALQKRIVERLGAYGLRVSVIWSIDEVNHVGLLDILPANATKLHAVRFLMEKKGFAEMRTVFAGDSGNDLPVLTSGLQAVLVRNARDEVRQEAVTRIKATGKRECLYLAHGGFLGMNGNYAAGVLEGLAHFLPETAQWMSQC